MASLAESSVGSVPVPQLEALQKNMLEHVQADPSASQESQAEVSQSPTPTTNASSGVAPLVVAPPTGTAVVPQSQDALHLVAQVHPSGRARAPLVPSASAPQKDMDSMLDATPSQQAFRMLTKAASFHAFPDGDTQPMESQVYRDFDGSMIRQPGEATSGQQQAAVEQGSNSQPSMTVDKSPRTCEEGDTGYIDLDRAFQPASPSSTTGFDELLASPRTQFPTTMNLQQHGQFAMPETPALAGRKHGRDGELLTSATTATKKTPAYSQLFGMAHNGQVLSATQLFNQTQAPSSPIPDQLRSDPVVTRPSPNINPPRAPSSPLEAFSSPIPPTTGRLASTGDPKVQYTSMRESQERRAARLRQELGRRAAGDDDLWDDDSDVHETARAAWQGRRMRRVMSDQALPEIGRLSAATRSSSRPSSANNMRAPIHIIDTPGTVPRGERLEFDDGFSESSSQADENMDDDMVDEDEERVSTGEDEEQNSNDEYDELEQRLRSQADDEDETVSTAANVEHEAFDENHPQDNELEVAHHATNGPRSANHPATTQHSAIADSQPASPANQEFRVSSRAGQQTSSASFVPGSQYAGRTSQDQARLAASQYSKRSQETRPVNITSSPPLPKTMDVDWHSRDAPDHRQAPTDQPASQRRLPKAHTTTNLEVPDSDLPEISHSCPAAPVSPDESNNAPIFSTAQTHASIHHTTPTKGMAAIASPLKMFNSQRSRLSDMSPRKAAGVRHFSELAVVTPPEGSGQTQADVDAVVDDVMTVEDKEYVATMANSPGTRASKKRKLAQKASTEKNARPEIHASTDESEINLNTSSLPNHGKDGEESRPVEELVPRASPADASKRNEHIHPCPTPLLNGTQASAQSREEAGAQAVSQLLADRSTKAAKKSKAKSRPLSKRNRADAKVDNSGTREVDVAATSHLDESLTEGRQPEHDGPQDTSKESATRVQANGVAPTEDRPYDGDDTENAVQDTTVVAPNRIFALFKGHYNQFYPATWLSSSADKQSFRIQFDETTITNIEPQLVCSLELRVGDTVKVDAANMRKEPYIIVGFGDVAATPEERDLGVDIFGRARAFVKAKSTRNDWASSRSAGPAESAKVHEVLVTDIYVTHTMWKNYSPRAFVPPVAARDDPIRVGTPSTRPQTPNITTPGSRTRRRTLQTFHDLSARNGHLREGSVASSSYAQGAGAFANMAFAISFTREEEHNRTEMMSLIQQNGGTVLDSGFLELFDIPGLESTRGTPKKVPRVHRAQFDVPKLQIKSEYAELGFVALIANSHHRKAKYMQALALGLPTLSSRWVTDSLDPRKNPSLDNADSAPLSWAQYLLPAGESSYLNGAVRSRMLAPGDAASTKFADTIASRPRLLNNEGVLTFPGKSKASRENREVFAFLTLALGAGRVRRVADLSDTRAVLEQEPGAWKWVYIDDSVPEAAAELFGQISTGATVGANKSKRKKRTSDRGKTEEASMSATDGEVTIVNDEFVIQSLILGALVD